MSGLFCFRFSRYMPPRILLPTAQEYVHARQEQQQDAATVSNTVVKTA